MRLHFPAHVRNSPFKDNVVLLAGASRGIGAQLADQLAQQGARLMLAARSLDQLQSVAERCRRSGAQADVLAADLMNEAQCRRLVEHTVERFRRIDTLLYNAGKGYPGRFDALPDAQTIRDEITLNYLGMVYCLHAALPHLKASRGRIVGVSSFGALVGLPGTAGYNASKHAMRGFLNSLRVELRRSGVSITLVYAGAVRTERLAETMGANVDRVPSMSPERCAQLILQAAARRRREVVLTFEGNLLRWLYQFAPGLLERQLAEIERLYRRA